MMETTSGRHKHFSERHLRPVERNFFSMKARFSSYLTSIRPGLEKVRELLERKYDYVSILATDSRGLVVRISSQSKSVGSQTMTTERGIVIRVCRDGLYSEYALNRFDPERAQETADEAYFALEDQMRVLASANVPVYDTGLLPDEPLELFF